MQGADRGARPFARARRAGAAILALRADDGSDHVEPVVGVDFIPSD